MKNYILLLLISFFLFSCSDNKAKNELENCADYKFSKINALENFTNQVDAFNKKNPQVLAYELNNQLTQSEMSIQYEKAKISNNDARTSLVEAIEGAQKQYEQIVAEESKDLSEYKSKISGRWWMGVPFLNKNNNKPENYFVACSYYDYEIAKKGDIPDRWIKTYNKFI